jgi:hypothetical protein
METINTYLCVFQQVITPVKLSVEDVTTINFLFLCQLSVVYSTWLLLSELLEKEISAFRGKSFLQTRHGIYFQHTGTCTFWSSCYGSLESALGNRWSGRRGPITWPSRSPDLLSLDRFLNCLMKELAYSTKVHTTTEFLHRIMGAAQIREST